MEWKFLKLTYEISQWVISNKASNANKGSEVMSEVMSEG